MQSEWWDRTRLRFYRRAGFVQEGGQEQGYYYNGAYSDFIMMRILRDEWMRRKEESQDQRTGTASGTGIQVEG